MNLTSPCMPWYFPKEFLHKYRKVGLPYNRHCPKGMPHIAWSWQNVLRYKDCRGKAVGKKKFGKECVTMPRWKTKQLRRAYYSAVSYADHELGRVLNELRALGLENDTIIVFLNIVM